MKFRLALFSVSLLLSALPAHAGSISAGFKQALNGKCSVWAPVTLAQEDYAVRYSGSCANGHAEGKGRAEWLYVNAQMKVKDTWSGSFRNGVFLADTKVPGRVEALRNGYYLLGMNRLGNAELSYLVMGPQDGGPDLCRIDRLIVVPVRETILADDAQVKQMFIEGSQRYQSQCPADKRALQVEAHRVPPVANSNGTMPTGIASARFIPNRGELSGYSNQISEKANRAAREANADKQKFEARKRFDGFTRKNGISVWLTPQQLDENPFRWEGKKVGIVVQLDRMLSRTTALVQQTRGWGTSLLLKGVTPEFPGDNAPLLLAAQVGKRETVAGRNGEVTALQLIEIQRCKEQECGDWLAWSWRNPDLIWGEPYSAKQ